MKILVAGATGGLGRSLVPKLVAAGHEVTGMIRSESNAAAVRAQGAGVVIADGLDAEAVKRAVSTSEPEVVVHQMTALRGGIDFKKFDDSFAVTNRLRTEGTDHLLAAGRAAGVRRVVAQSYAPAIYARAGAPVKDEADPLDASPPGQARTTVEAIRHLERAVTEASWTEGVVLRYGSFYGPGTSISLGPEGTMLEVIRKRGLPLVGEAGGVWSFIHVEDAADATVKAIEGRGRGVYNIVDDEPAAVAEWLPAAAQAVGAPAPRRVPRWLGRLFAGEFATVMMTEARGASNAKAARELGWTPRYASWRQGFATGLG
jgi:nucleoside-diphosphate-sugar epimerase